MISQLSFSERAAESLKKDPETSPLKIYLLRLMVAKKTNLCLSANVTSTSSLLKLADTCGPYICILKTHADFIDDFGPRTIKGLRELSRQHKFLIFEDRKFGDLSTVQAQYASGPLQIATWAHIVNAHAVPGPSIVTALREAAKQVLGTEGRGVVSTEVWVGTPEGSEDEPEVGGPSGKAETMTVFKKKQAKVANSRKDSIVANTTISQTFEVSGSQQGSQSQSPAEELQRQLKQHDDDDEEDDLQRIGEIPTARALLLFAQMSSDGNLMDEKHTQHTASLARENQDFVVGYIAQKNLNAKNKSDDLLILTPGIQLPPKGQEEIRVKGDGLGQQYRTPAEAICKDGCDVVIVGRGIIDAKNRAEEAQRYRDEAWKAYESRVRR